MTLMLKIVYFQVNILCGKLKLMTLYFVKKRECNFKFNYHIVW